MHAHRVAPDGAALALAAPPALERLLVELGGLVGDQGLDRLVGALGPRPATALLLGRLGAGAAAPAAPAAALAAVGVVVSRRPSRRPAWPRSGGGPRAGCCRRCGAWAAATWGRARPRPPRPRPVGPRDDGRAARGCVRPPPRVRPRPRPWPLRASPWRVPPSPSSAPLRAPSAARDRGLRPPSPSVAVGAVAPPSPAPVRAPRPSRSAPVRPPPAPPLRLAASARDRFRVAEAPLEPSDLAESPSASSSDPSPSAELPSAGSRGLAALAPARPRRRRLRAASPEPASPPAGAASDEVPESAPASVPESRPDVLSGDPPEAGACGRRAARRVSRRGRGRGSRRGLGPRGAWIPQGPASAPPGRKRLSRTWVVSSLLMTHAPRRAEAASLPARGRRPRAGRRRPASIGGCRVTRATTQSGSMAATSSTGRRARGWVARSASSFVPRPDRRGASGATTSVTGPSTRRSRMAGRTSSVTVLPLRSRVNASSVAASARGHAGCGVGRGDVGHLDVPGAAGHRLLERLGSGGQRHRALHLDARGEDRVEPRGQLLDRRPEGASRSIDVEVLGLGLVAGRQRQPEAEPGPGREALGVGDADAGAPQGPLPDAGHVTVAGEADLAVLGEPDANAWQRPVRGGVDALGHGPRPPVMSGTPPAGAPAA